MAAKYEKITGVMARKLVYLFRVTLNEIEPPIWRGIAVPASYSFWDLHVAIQDAMGWQDYHLHAFQIRNPATGEEEMIGIPDDDGFEGDPEFLPGWLIPLRGYFLRPGQSANYEYDFGDSWSHRIELERIVDRDPGLKLPMCLGGKRACPPEDCGGTPGYEELLATLRNPADEEYQSTIEWLGGPFDPEAFDPSQVRFDNPKRRWKTAFEDGPP